MGGGGHAHSIHITYTSTQEEGGEEEMWLILATTQHSHGANNPN